MRLVVPLLDGQRLRVEDGHQNRLLRVKSLLEVTIGLRTGVGGEVQRLFRTRQLSAQVDATVLHDCTVRFFTVLVASTYAETKP